MVSNQFSFFLLSVFLSHICCGTDNINIVGDSTINLKTKDSEETSTTPIVPEKYDTHDDLSKLAGTRINFNKKLNVTGTDLEENLTSLNSWLETSKEEGEPVQCWQLLERFSKASAAFTGCANVFAKPIGMCRNCMHHFINVRTYYYAFEHSEEEGINCKDLLTSRDKVEIIHATYEYIVGPDGLWSKGYCSKCYTEPLNHTSVLTESTNSFFENYYQVDACFEKYPNKSSGSDGKRSSACTECQGVYKNLSTSYRQMNVHYPNLENICFDILDAMNTTQQRWGTGNFHCGRKLAFNLPLVIAIFCVLLSPVVFHLAVRFGRGGEPNLERIVSQPHLTQQLSRSEHWGGWDVGRDGGRAEYNSRQDSREASPVTFS